MSRYIIELEDEGDGGKHELSNLKFLGSALSLALGSDGFKLYTSSGKRIAIDVRGDDNGEYPESKAVEITGDRGEYVIRKVKA